MNKKKLIRTVANEKIKKSECWISSLEFQRNHQDDDKLLHKKARVSFCVTRNSKLQYLLDEGYIFYKKYEPAYEIALGKHEKIWFVCEINNQTVESSPFYYDDSGHVSGLLYTHGMNFIQECIDTIYKKEILKKLIEDKNA
jgi:hypothetical protein